MWENMKWKKWQSWPQVHACQSAMWPERMCENPEAPRGMRWEERHRVSHAAHTRAGDTKQMGRRAGPEKLSAVEILTDTRDRPWTRQRGEGQYYSHHKEPGLHRQMQRNKTHISNCRQTRTTMSHDYTYCTFYTLVLTSVCTQAHTGYTHLASQKRLRSPGRSWFLLLLNQIWTLFSDQLVFLHRDLTSAWDTQGIMQLFPTSGCTLWNSTHWILLCRLDHQPTGRTNTWAGKTTILLANTRQNVVPKMLPTMCDSMWAPNYCSFFSERLVFTYLCWSPCLAAEVLF